MFAAMERAKGTVKFLDWGVANATLEEVGVDLSCDFASQNL